jgi:hypothetical protein
MGPLVRTTSRGGGGTPVRILQRVPSPRGPMFQRIIR